MDKVDINAPFEKELDRLKHTVELAVAAEAKRIRLFSFYGTNGEAAYRDAVLESLSKFVEAAKGSGVTLCHENEKGIYGDNAARCLEIHKAIPEMPAIFDPANFVQTVRIPLRFGICLGPTCTTITPSFSFVR